MIPSAANLSGRAVAFALLASLTACSATDGKASRAAQAAFARPVAPLPANFLWGVSSSGFQSEGHTSGANWNRYIARDQSAEAPAGRKEPYGNSVDFYDTYDADIARAAALGAKVYRISINWTRVEPQPGRFSRQGLDFYDRVFDSMRRHHIRPLITLNHWDYPQWVGEQGGWTNRKTVDDFALLTTVLARRYGSQVDLWLTFNEPFFAVEIEKANAPLDRSQASAMKDNLIAAHQQAYAILHRTVPHVLVSSNYAWSGHGILTSVESDWFLKAVRHQLDYVALDYYFPAYEQLATLKQLAAGTAWKVALDPFGMYVALRTMHRDFPGLPILITENGMQTENGQPRADGVTRAENMRDTVYWVQRARQDGVPVFGYMYWSLTDNYEWGSYTPRLGLYTVNVRTDPKLARIPTDGAAAYATLVRDHGVPGAFRPTERPARINCSATEVAREDRATCRAAAIDR